MLLFKLCIHNRKVHSSIKRNILSGPENWHKEYGTCLGKHQSPINILEHLVENVTLPILKFDGLENPHPAYIQNNGHTGEYVQHMFDS